MNAIKKFIPLFFISLFFLQSLNAQAESVINNDHQDVVNTAYNYFNGVSNGDQALLAKTFEMDYGHMKMVSIDKETGQEYIKTVPFKEFAGYFNTPTKDTWQANVLSVDIVDGKMAMVKLDFDTPKTHYVDYLVMYKINNQWRIVNKTFTMEKK
jgi:hypothetical protein